jgi:argonaute-like protein implicated in RNA metabolism and viral defense
MSEFFEVLWRALKLWIKSFERKQKIQEKIDAEKIDVTNTHVTTAENLNDLIDNISGRPKT